MKEVIESSKAPKAIGPYSQAIRSGNLIFCSGQIPLDYMSGRIVSEDVKDQAKQVLLNLVEVLKAAGASPQDVIKTTIFVKNMDDFAAVNEVYSAFFTPPYPARSTVEVSRLPRDVKVEIEAIASLKL